jgi:hypothetical protein
MKISKPEITFVGRLKGRNNLRDTDIDGCVINHIRMGFEGNRLWR